MFNWAATSFFDLGGNVNLGLIFGNTRARYNESWAPWNIDTTSTSGGNYSQVHGTTSWAALLLSGELKAGFHYETKNNDEWRVEGGIGGDQYLSSNNSTTFSYQGNSAFANGGNNGSITASNQILFRNVFIGLSYRG